MAICVNSAHISAQTRQQARDSMLLKLEGLGQDTARVNVLIRLGINFAKPDPDSALGYIQEAISLAKQLNFQYGEAGAEEVYCDILSNQQAFEEAMLHCNKAESIFQNIGREDGLVNTYYVRGNLYRDMHNVNAALKDYLAGIPLAEEHGPMRTAALLYRVAGGAYEDINEMENAVEYYLKALKIGEEKGFPIVVAGSSFDIGSLKDVLKDYEGALPYLLRARAILDSLQEEYLLVSILNGLGTNYKHLKEYEKSLETFQDALRLIQKFGNLYGELIIRYNLGLLHQEFGEPDRAIEELQLSLQLSKKLNNQYATAQNLYGLGKSFSEAKQFKKAIMHLEEALELSQATSFYKIRISCLTQLSKALYHDNQGKRAYEVYREYVALKDSTFNEERSAQVTEMETKYETEKKDAEIARQELELEKEARRRLQILIIGGGMLLSVVLMAVILLLRQRARKREADLALQLKESEAANLRELDHMKSRFFANISHEFRTPLTLILGPLQKLISQTHDGDPGMFYALMHRNASRLLQLINQLMDLSKLESGKLSLTIAQADVMAFIRRLSANFESLAESKNIHFHTHFSPESFEMAFDQDKLEKTINNLLSNAFKFTEEEGDIWLRVWVEEKNLRIEIQDNGIGMNQGDLEHIFDRFYQVEGQEYQGTGIGLALVKELVDLHQGDISVSSEEGVGSMFSISLPIPPETSEVWKEPVLEKLIPQSPVEIPKAEKNQDVPSVLIVEDNQDVRSFLIQLLQTQYRVLESENGLDGLKLAKEHLPDLILSDIMMPKMDGNAFAKALKTEAYTSHIPIILLTAKSGRQSKIEGLETGADDYLAKPFDEEELLIRIRNLIEQRQRLSQQFGKEIVKLKPDLIAVNSADQQFLERVIGIIEQYMGDETFSIEDLGREVGMSRSQLHRKIKALTDQSPSVFLRTLRLKRAHQLLRDQAGTASEISFMVGFSSPAYFSKCFKDQYGIVPSEAKKLDQAG